MICYWVIVALPVQAVLQKCAVNPNRKEPRHCDGAEALSFFNEKGSKEPSPPTGLFL